MRKNKIPEYDIIETIDEILNPELEEIQDAKNTLLLIERKDGEKNGID